MSAENPPNQRALLARCFRAEIVAAGDEALGFREFGVVIVVDGGQPLSCRNPITDLLVQNDSHGRIHGVFFALASPAQNDASRAELLALQRC